MRETFLFLLFLLLSSIYDAIRIAPLNYYDSVLLYSNWGRKRPGKWRMALDCIAGGMAMAVGWRLSDEVFTRIGFYPGILPGWILGMLIGAITVGTLYTALHGRMIREEWKLDPAYTLGFVLSMGFAFGINYFLLDELATIAAILRYQVRAKGYLTP